MSVMVGAIKNKEKSGEDRGKYRFHIFLSQESLGLMSHAQSIFDRCGR